MRSRVNKLNRLNRLNRLNEQKNQHLRSPEPSVCRSFYSLFTSLLWGSALLFLFQPFLPYGNAQDKEPVTLHALTEQLGSESFAEREAAGRTLLKMGMAIYGDLAHIAEQTEDDEIRARCLRLRKQIARQDVSNGIRALRAEGEGMNIETGMWLLARVMDPTADRDDIDKALDDYAETAREKLAGRKPKDMSQEDVLDVLCSVLFEEAGFDGANEDEYDHPDNSSITRVLASGKGLPIILSHILVSVAERVDVKLEGVHTPGRYMVRFPSRGDGEGNLYVDAFGGGTIMTRGDLPGLFKTRFLDAFLEPRTNLETVERMMRNLESDLFEVDRDEEATYVNRLRALLLKEIE